MEEFKGYLKEKGFAPRTITTICRNVRQLGQWAQENGHDMTNINYTLLKGYILHCKHLDFKPMTINGKIKSISHYNRFLQGESATDTASRLRVKGAIRDIAFDLFTLSELDSIYNNYPEWKPKKTMPDNMIRNHVALGLHIYQGIKHGELAALETYHVDLEKGRAYIPSIGRNNSRTLDLMPFQIMPIHNYITSIRKSMLQKYPEDGEKLFPGYKTAAILETIGETIAKHCPRLKKFTQLRASVITGWLTRYNLREVQYMAGHRYVSSTERYSRENIESLKKEVEKYHPLNHN